MKLGTEGLDRYWSYEANHAAHKAIVEVACVKPGEVVAITCDTQGDARVAEALAAAAHAIGAFPVEVRYETRPNPLMEPPQAIHELLRHSNVWIDLAVMALFRSDAYNAAIDAGSRYLCLSGMDIDMLVRTIGRVDYPRMLDLGNAITRLTQASTTLRITSPAGTDFRARHGKDGAAPAAAAVGGLRGRASIPRYGVHQSGGVLSAPSTTAMLGGQVVWLPEEESMEGTLVFDGSIAPPFEIGVVDKPVEVTLKRGRIVDIRGGLAAGLWKRWIDGFGDENMRRLAHFSYGFNPGVLVPSGRILEDERIFGAVQVGFGSSRIARAPSHTDGVILNPTTWLDDTQIETEGRYVLPELVEACRKLGAPGY